ncbi:MAG: hypothetical protein ACKOYM_00680, partial [Actinomycetes bacterium]
LRQTAAARHYMGSLTVPAVAMIDETMERFARTRPGVYEWFTDGLPASVFAEHQLPVVLP